MSIAWSLVLDPGKGIDIYLLGKIAPRLMIGCFSHCVLAVWVVMAALTHPLVSIWIWFLMNIIKEVA